MDSATSTEVVTAATTVTVPDTNRNYDRRWCVKTTDAQLLGEPPETLRTPPIILIPSPALRQLIYVAGPDPAFPLSDHLAAYQPFLVGHGIWVGGEMPAWQRLYYIPCKAIQLHT